jgi:Flp pilus assembly protein CpaB
MRGKTLTLLLALSVAAVAAVSVYMYVGKVEQRSTDGLKTVPVLVATQSFPTGTTGKEMIDAEGVETQAIPQRYALPGAFGFPEDLVGLTLTDNVAAGEQIIAERFASAEQNAFLSDFPEGTEALALSSDWVKGVAGHLSAGDTLNAYVTMNGGGAKDAKVTGSYNAATGDFKIEVAENGAENGTVSSRKVFGSDSETFLLLRGLPIQEVQSPFTGDEDGAIAPSSGGSTTLIVAVTPKQAALLIQAAENHKLWFTLVPQEVDAK